MIYAKAVTEDGINPGLEHSPYKSMLRQAPHIDDRDSEMHPRRRTKPNQTKAYIYIYTVARVRG